MDQFLAAGLAVAVVVLFAAFGLAAPERRRPLLLASAALVVAAIATPTLVYLFGPTPVRLSLFAIAMLAMTLIGALIWRHSRHA